MNVHTFFLLYALSLSLLIVFDFLWLGFIAKGFYRTRMGGLMGKTVWIAALVFYVLFTFGLTFFATYPAATRGTFVTASILGGLFGFFTYATYDLSNLATLRGWSWQLSVVDMCWGTVLGSLVATAAVFVNTLVS